MINYKQAGFNTLSEMFDNMLKKQSEGDHVGFVKMSSMLTSQQKVAFIEHSKGHEVFAGAMKDLVTESCGDYRVGKDYADFIKMSLSRGGYIVTENPRGYECCGDNWSYPEVHFTDGRLIEGYVMLFQKEVHLKAVDAKERIYNKSITYLDENDLIESINHFKHDIEETFTEENVDYGSLDYMLQDEEFMKSIGAEEQLVRKSSSEETLDKEATSFTDLPESTVALSRLLGVDTDDVTSNDGENFTVKNDTKTYKVSEKPLDLKEQGYSNDVTEFGNKLFYIYWK